jgi:hypothetical protein
MMQNYYVDLGTMKVCSHTFLQRTRQTYKSVAFTAGELAVMNAAPLDESATGDSRTGNAVLDAGVYYREFRPFNASELAGQAAQAASADKLTGVLFEGIMCSATKEDMWGLASVRPYVMAGNDTKFQFDNGNTLTLTLANYAAFEAVWTPFRAGFFL